MRRKRLWSVANEGDSVVAGGAMGAASVTVHEGLAWACATSSLHAGCEGQEHRLQHKSGKDKLSMVISMASAGTALHQAAAQQARFTQRIIKEKTVQGIWRMVLS